MSDPHTETSREADAPAEASRHFIRQIIDADQASGKWGGRVHTRFPPEPNGFLHIGHAKSICLNFGLAKEFGGACNLRFDDTNPVKEEQRYVDSIIEDIRWLGFRWEGEVRFASDYFDFMYECAERLVQDGKAYVCDQTPEEMRKARGTLTEPGTPSPGRNRSPDENLDLLRRMRAGEFPDGSRTLRAKIDMASPNIVMRDPVMYRILHATHHRTGDAWPIYPMYDFAHCLEDSMERITHSICTLEFENNRPLYDWFLDNLGVHHPQQIEFARLILNYTVMSKRKFLELVRDGHVMGWDDPRMPTISGLRRRGYTPESIRAFSEEVGVSKYNSTIDVVRLENAIRDDLNKRAPRRMAVLNPVKVVIENYPEGEVEYLDAVNNPEDASCGVRGVPFAREIYIERDDFMEDPPKKFFRLAPGAEVRLRAAYWITCTGVVKNDAGEIVELRATYDPQTRGGDNPPPDAEGKVRKVKGTLHWVSAQHAVDAEVRMFDRLFTAENPDKRPKDAPEDPPEDWDYKQNLNPESLVTLRGCKLEPMLAERGADEPEWSDGIRRFQFERLGYFCIDADSKPGAPVFNRTVTLKDSWSRAGGK
ncbi:MAG: glutamine--tRNA ligase/YqeY domain fusion protein [Phycisphaeraceae bacterium]|nr:MAG: glutamine--tRNA ligase/YqeY domain fusion protein [Phycisphaeraceae bacterium]